MKDRNKNAYLSIEDRILIEKKKLMKYCKNLDKDKVKVLQKLIESMSFMSVTLSDLEKNISEEGIEVEYQNGLNQFGTKKSPKVEVYNTMIKNYNTVVKQFMEYLPSENKIINEGNELAKFVMGK